MVETATNRSPTVAIVALATMTAYATMPAAARTNDVRAIALVDQRGATFRLGDLAGEPAIVTFVASRCTDACPIANVAFQRLERRLRRDRVRAHLVTITLDPTFDTPDVFAGLARRSDADAGRWTFASGTPEHVRAILHAFGVTATRGRDGIPDLHSSFVYVLDAHAKLATTLLLSTAIDDDVLRAIAAHSPVARRASRPNAGARS